MNLRGISNMKKRLAIIKGNVAKIPLGVGAKGGFALVDSNMAWLAQQHNWCLDSHGYAISRYKGAKIYLHHFIIGKAPVGLVTDHKNRNKTDCREINLRHATISDNMLNKNMRADNTSGYTGVYKMKDKWQAIIFKNNIKTVLGVFNTPLEAAIERDKFDKSH